MATTRYDVVIVGGGAALSPAAPPPTITTSYRVVAMLICPSSRPESSPPGSSGGYTSFHRLKEYWQDLLPVWQNRGMVNELDDVLGAVGPRLRALRTERNLTLGDV